MLTKAADLRGLSGFIYRVKQYEGITVACKASEENIFLPADEEDFEDFIYNDSLDQLLNYWVSQRRKILHVSVH